MCLAVVAESPQSRCPESCETAPVIGIPERMRALVLTGFGGSDVFAWTTVEVPTPGPGELLVRVLGTSANPLDYQTRRGDYREDLALPAIIGSDVSGVVAAAGPGVRDFARGDEVFYMPAPFSGGSFAEFLAVDEALVAR